MSSPILRNITNNFQDVRLISLASWREAAEFPDRDHGGPYIVAQEGYDPQDARVTADEFVLGRSGKWLSLSYFYKMPVSERRAEFLYATAAEVMKVMAGLPPKPEVIRPGSAPEAGETPTEEDELTRAVKSAKAGKPK
ncbi:MAG: hypothetical protein HC841_03715 [Verrucomicrobiae bacterium]|nr:hypothetical protein [Verrucomicrobiae bacterium]